MSYDFYLARRESIEVLIARADDLDPDDEVLNPGMPDPQTEERKRVLADALIDANPQLTRFEFGFPEIAEFHGITEAEARLRYRHIELNGPDDSNGIQITIFDDHVLLTVPYWHSGAAARAVFDEIWRDLEIVERVSGYVTYDAQVGKRLDLAVDQPLVLRAYGRVIEQLPDIIGSGEAPEKPRKPWWKFW